MALRQRRYREHENPVAYPAWRLWEDRRVRTDDAVLALLLGIRIARADLDRRSTEASESTLVSDLYSEEEIPFSQAFRVTVDEAHSRWTNGEVELARLTILQGVAALDDLLAGTIDLLRALGVDQTVAGTVDTKLSLKLRHLQKHGALSISDATLQLHDLCIAIRNGLTHHAALQQKVIDAWGRLSDTAEEWWASAAGRPFPFTDPGDELVMDDRELLAVFKLFDRVALEVNASVRDEVPEEMWARLVARDYWNVNPGRAGNPKVNVGAAQGLAQRSWRLTLADDSLRKAFEDKGLREDRALDSLLIAPR
jgi:hypothetical protein